MESLGNLMNKLDKQILAEMNHIPLMAMAVTGMIYLVSFVLGYEEYTFYMVYAVMGMSVYILIASKIEPKHIIRLIRWLRTGLPGY